jgi:two-component system sensor histidine kinase KdpD
MARFSKSDRLMQADPAVDGAPGPGMQAWLPPVLTAVAVPLLSVGAITVLGYAVSDVIAGKSVAMLYLAAVVVSALAGGRVSAVLAASLSFLAYNYFFIEPRWTFTVAHPDEVIVLFMFVGVALVTGTLAASLSEHAAMARQQAQSTQSLLEFSRKLSGALGLDAVYATIASHVGATLRLETVLLAAEEGGELAIVASVPSGQRLAPDALSLARTAAERKVGVGFLTDTAPESAYAFLPILSAQRVLGVLGINLAERGEPLSQEESRTLVSMLEQAAIAIDRARWARESARAAVYLESERLQSALLSSLSHDFRTPLASITGAATTLRQLGDRMDRPTRDDLLQSIEQDAGQLNRFIANLFDMTRIESGGIKIRREPVDLPEVIERAIARVRAIYPDFLTSLSVATGLPPALGDAILLEQVLFNLLENARKYGGPGLPVAVFARREQEEIVLAVTDQGKGIPAEDLDRIFEKFYRRAKGDGRAAGTGLGLSIARGFIAAMGGGISAESPAARKRGTRFVVRLPIAKSSVP